LAALSAAETAILVFLTVVVLMVVVLLYVLAVLVDAVTLAV
jgi:hypothetical protein